MLFTIKRLYLNVKIGQNVKIVLKLKNKSHKQKINKYYYIFLQRVKMENVDPSISS